MTDKLPSAYFIFVQLGENPAPILNDMANFALNNLPRSEAILVTDYPALWKDFPGVKIQYSSSDRSDTFLEFIKRNRELSRISGGYWLFTLERILSLQVAEKSISSNVPIIHLESDVFSMLDEDVLEYLICTHERSAVPRYSESQGIASIIFSPSISQLCSDVKELEKLLTQNHFIDNDMALLGEALNTGAFDQLPSSPIDASRHKALLFDGAAYGQILFGQDPLHNNGYRKTGYINPNFSIDLQEVKFELSKKSSSDSIISVHWNGSSYRLVNLHIHSKEHIQNIDSHDEYWERVLEDANTGVCRVGEIEIIDVIHSKPIKIIDKFRRARKVGFMRQASRSLRYRFSILIK
jgi:hypothetical protein